MTFPPSLCFYFPFQSPMIFLKALLAEIHITHFAFALCFFLILFILILFAFHALLPVLHYHHLMLLRLLFHFLLLLHHLRHRIPREPLLIQKRSEEQGLRFIVLRVIGEIDHSRIVNRHIYQVPEHRLPPLVCLPLTGVCVGTRIDLVYARLSHVIHRDHLWLDVFLIV